MSYRNPLLMIVGPLVGVVAGCSDYAVQDVREQEVFTQPGEIRAADILFVVDNSASMDEEEALLAENFSAFVDVLTQTYADYQIGIVTTDVETVDAGVLREGILTATTDDIAGAFERAVGVGTYGSRDEQGLAAATLAADPTRNPGFVRPDSRFNVVFVSDEDDHSPGEVATYIDGLKNLSGDGGFAAHALVGDVPAGCVSGTSAADPGARYLEVVKTSDGWSDSICADDYSPLLTQVGLDAAGWANTFPLEELPQPESITVMVDAVTIPQRDIDGWRYSSGDNAIIFNGRAVPRPGMDILIDYTPWVGPASAGDTGEAVATE